MDVTVYSIIPSGNKPLYFLYGILAFLVLVVGAVAVVLSITIRGSQSASFLLSSEGLELRGDLYGRKIPADRLRGAAARLVDLRTDVALRPKSRRFGTGLPGYGSGWFSLNNGEKALVYLTDQSRVVYLPTRDGFSVLLSVADPERFLKQVAEVAPGR